MKLLTAESTARDTEVALQEMLSALHEKGGERADLIICAATCEHDLERMRVSLSEAYPEAALIGGTSCSGVMTERGHFANDGDGCAVLIIEDADGAYGVGVATLDSPFDAGVAAAEAAMRAADRDGERPEACFLISAPGSEEAVLAGVESVIGDDVPLIGGSSADNTLEGRWRQFDAHAVHGNAVALALLYPSGAVTARFHSGYDPTPREAVVTAVEGRTLVALDGRPAAEVYNAWTGGLIEDLLADGGAVLERTSRFPLGRQIANVRGEPYFVLSHPETVTPDGALTVFTDLSVGDRIVLMAGSRANLVERAGNVAAAARDAENIQRQDIAGSLVIFCAGCMMTVGEAMNEAQERIRRELGPETPFLAAYTFGEQGSMADGTNRHGNLMISVMHLTHPGAL